MENKVMFGTLAVGAVLVLAPPTSSAVSARDAGSLNAVAAPSPGAENASINLHVHTYCSDGSDTPEQVVQAAQKAGIRYLAITDHDSTACVERARAEARKSGLELIPGMEVSTEDDSIHILALNIDIGHPGIQALIRKNWKARIDRAKVTIANLNKIQVRGQAIQVTLAEVMADRINLDRAADGQPPLGPADFQAMNEDGMLGRLRSPLTRPDIARVLVKKGYVKDSKEAFNLYLGDDGYAAVNLEGIPFTEVIRTVHAAGGLAVLAHPYTIYKYKKFPRAYGGRSYRNFDDLLQDMLVAGLDGVEQYKNRFGPSDWLVDITNRYRELSGRAVLLTPGSDSHGHSGVGETDILAINIPQAAADDILRALGKSGGTPPAPPARAERPLTATDAASVQAAVDRTAAALTGR